MVRHATVGVFWDLAAGANRSLQSVAQRGTHFRLTIVAELQKKGAVSFMSIRKNGLKSDRAVSFFNECL